MLIMGSFLVPFDKLRVDLLSQTTLTVRYTVAIRQAPHPLLSFCALMAQIRWLLACDFHSLYYVQPHALRPLKYSFGARHINHSIKACLIRQDRRYLNNARAIYYRRLLHNAQALNKRLQSVALLGIKTPAKLFLAFRFLQCPKCFNL